MKFPRADAYPRPFVRENMMGPSSLVILEELTRDLPLRSGMKVLDWGCGRGLTSVFLAKEFGVSVTALDLWIPAEENEARFREAGVADRVTAVCGDGTQMSFEKESFDAVVSVDAYHYAGFHPGFFREHIRPFLKAGALVALAFPGRRKDEPVPPEMVPFWNGEEAQMIQPACRWRELLSGEIDGLRVEEMRCFDRAWNDWLACENPYAAEDRPMMAAGGDRFLNLLAVTGRAV